MPNLFPTGFENENIGSLALTQSSVGYRNGILFDYDNGDFVRDGRNRLLDSTGIESWKSWCINNLSTERYSCLACSTDFGIETKAAMRATSRAEAEGILSSQITDAIMADPYERAAYIADITYDWTAPDAVLVSVIIQGKDDVTIDVTAYLTKGER